MPPRAPKAMSPAAASSSSSAPGLTQWDKMHISNDYHKGHRLSFIAKAWNIPLAQVKEYVGTISLTAAANVHPPDEDEVMPPAAAASSSSVSPPQQLDALDKKLFVLSTEYNPEKPLLNLRSLTDHEVLVRKLADKYFGQSDLQKVDDDLRVHGFSLHGWEVRGESKPVEYFEEQDADYISKVNVKIFNCEEMNNLYNQLVTWKHLAECYRANADGDMCDDFHIKGSDVKELIRTPLVPAAASGSSEAASSSAAAAAARPLKRARDEGKKKETRVFLSVRSLRGAKKGWLFPDMEAFKEKGPKLALAFMLGVVGEWTSQNEALEEWIKEHRMRRTGEDLKTFGPFRIQTEAGNDNRKLVELWLREILPERLDENEGRGPLELEEGTIVELLSVTDEL